MNYGNMDSWLKGNYLQRFLYLSVHYFTETLKHSRGRYTKQQVHRAGCMAGPYTRQLDEVFHQRVAGTHVKKGSQNEAKYAEDVFKFIDCYRKDNLFAHINGREHQSFPKFKWQCIIKNPAKLKEALSRYSKKMEWDMTVLYEE